MCRLRYIAMRDYQESLTTGQTHRQTDAQTDAEQSDPYVPLCFAGDTIMLVHFVFLKIFNFYFKVNFCHCHRLYS